MSTVDEQDPSTEAEEAETPERQPRVEGRHARRRRYVEQSRDLIREYAEDRQRRGLSPVFSGLWRYAHYLTILGSLALVAVVVVVSRVFELKTSLAIGITVVVLLGGFGLFCRGIGELKEGKESKRWKAFGYFMGALAYLMTALVALVNGLPALSAS